MQRLVKGHFGLRGPDLECRVPRAPIGAVEAAAERVGVGEGGVDDTIVRYAEEELVHADVGEQVVLREQAVVRGVVEVVQITELGLAVREACEHGASIVPMLRRDQAVRVVAADERGEWSRRHIPPRRASSNRRTVCIAVTPPLSM